MWILYAVVSTLIAVGEAQRKDYLPPSNNGYTYDRPAIPFPPNNKWNEKPNTYLPPVITTSTHGPSGPAYTPPTQGPITSEKPISRPPIYTVPTPGHRPAYVPPFQGTPNGHDHPHDHGHGDHDHGDHHHHEPGMPFDFSYSVVEGGNDYRHNAVSDGDVTRGEYRVALPDGRTQIVKYTADWKNGFNAEVTYEGEAQYPEQPRYGGGPSGGPAHTPPGTGDGYHY